MKNFDFAGYFIYDFYNANNFFLTYHNIYFLEKLENKIVINIRNKVFKGFQEHYLIVWKYWAGETPGGNAYTLGISKSGWSQFWEHLLPAIELR